MHKDIAVKLINISKVYKLYDKPVDRLKESLHPLKKKYHKEFYALKNINLEIKKGEVLGIVGVNGAGKSTLLKIIAGVLTPTSGRITVNGKLNAILELSSGLKPERTGRENIKLNLQINGIEKDVEKITQEIIEFADIGEHIDQSVKTYSSGMKARLGFGLATSTDPDILIVDEVLAVGDILFRRKCYGRIEKLFKDGKTVIFVSHSAQSVIEFCSRAILLYDREIILEGTPKKVTDFYQKLLFSKNKQKVLNEITGQIEVEKEPEQREQVLEISTTKEIIKKNIASNIRINTSNYWPELMKIESKYLNPDEVEFSNITILNRENEKVNILQTDDEYTIEYDVLFKKNFLNVFLGCQIRNEKGAILSGTNTNVYEHKTYSIEKNEKYHFSYSFNCHLLRGDYFLLVYITDIATNFKSQVLDAYWVKVQNKCTKHYGMVSLEQRLKIIKAES
jgi:lipopolysaccharide transport system ATP-binding protein